MSWFNEVTGTSDYERQSWRDNYNGGNAAGDWTGNVNAGLQEQRERYGTTWSGSSSQPSALELAQSYVGSGGGSVGPSSGSTGGGSGNRTAQTLGAPAPATGPGRSLVVTAPVKTVGGAGNAGRPWSTMSTPPDFVPPMDRYSHMGSPSKVSGRPLPFLGVPIELNPYIPPAQVMEDELGEAEFLSPGWFAQWASVPGHIYWNVERARQSAETNLGKSIDAGIDAYKHWPVGGSDGGVTPLYDQQLPWW